MKKYVYMLSMMLLFIVVSESQAQKFLPTNLRITVIDGLGNYVEGATVKIYKSKDDYMNSENPVATLETNKKGIVKFKKLEPAAYYIDARTDDMNNDGEGVATEPLDEGKTNRVNVVIE